MWLSRSPGIYLIFSKSLFAKTSHFPAFLPSFLVSSLFTSTFTHWPRQQGWIYLLLSVFDKSSLDSHLNSSQFQVRRDYTKPFELSHSADQNKPPQLFPSKLCSAPSGNGVCTGHEGCCLQGPHGARHGGWDQGRFHHIQSWQFLVRLSYFYGLSVLLVAAIFWLLAQFQKSWWWQFGHFIRCFFEGTEFWSFLPCHFH